MKLAIGNIKLLRCVGDKSDSCAYRQSENIGELALINDNIGTTSISLWEIQSETGILDNRRDISEPGIRDEHSGWGFGLKVDGSWLLGNGIIERSIFNQ